MSDGIEAGAEGKGGGSFVRKGFDSERAREELRGGKKLSRGELRRCRVRYFSDGLVLGSPAFVEEAFASRREWFGVKRKCGARGLPLASGGLFRLGDLKKETLS